MAFTVGMTFQVSDTVVKSWATRRPVLRHALLSHVFGTVIIASMINLIGGLGNSGAKRGRPMAAHARTKPAAARSIRVLVR